MFKGVPILSIITFFPILVAGFLMLSARWSDRAQLEQNAPRVALITTLAVFLLSLIMVFNFDSSNAGFQFTEEFAWLGGGIKYRMGVDGISVLFVLLTAFLTPLCIIASQASIKKRMLEYMVAFLVLETLMIGTFCALDMVLFYLFFEAVLIPMFIIIGVWGGANRVYAAYKFFLYTLLGSVLMLAAMLWLYSYSGQVLGAGNATTDIRQLAQLDIPLGAQTWLWLAFFASFAVKMYGWHSSRHLL